MFISGLYLNNFKKFKDQFVNLHAPITLLLGPNSSGKSSVIKSMLGLKQTVSPTNEHEVFAAQGDYVELGTYEDYAYMHDKNENIMIGLDIRDLSPPSHFKLHKEDLKYQIEYDYDAITDQARLQTIMVFNNNIDTDSLIFELSRKGTVRDGYWLDIGDKASEFLRKSFWLIPPSDSRKGLPLSLKHIERFKFSPIKPKNNQYHFYHAFNELIIQLMNTLERDLFYLGPLRSSPARSYIRTSHRSAVGPKGEHTPSVFATLDKRQKKVTTGKEKSELKISYDHLMRWTEILFPGKKVSTETNGELVKLKVSSFNNNSYRQIDSINDVGFGFSQIFPILVQIAVMPVNSTLIIEQPELHLHPAAQAKLAQIIVEGTNIGRRFIIETHSEHFVRGLQLSISEHRKGNKEGLSYDKLRMYFVPENGDMRDMRINEWGELIDEWPSGFFDESYNLSYAMMINKMEALNQENEAMK